MKTVRSKCVTGGGRAVRGALTAAAIALVPAGAGCGGAEPADVVVERVDSAGVEIVTNRGSDVPLAWSFDSLYSVGGTDADADVVAQVQWSGIASDGSGRLFVMDGMNMHVAVFGTDGELVRTMGGEGGGPGEFARPYALDVWDGRVAVLDAMHRAVIRFDTSGVPLDRIRLERFNPRPGLAQGPYGIAIPWQDYRRDEPTSYQRLTVMDTASNSTDVAQMAESTPAMAPFERCNVSVPAGPIFAPLLLWDGTAAAIAVNAEPAYVIDVYDGRERVRTVRRDLPVRELTRADALEAFADGWTIRIGGTPCTVPADELVDARGFAPELQTVARIRLSPTGELWAERRTVGDEDGPIDVFAADGAYVGTLPPGSPFPEAFIGDDGIAVIETDELDVSRAVVYRIGRA